MVAVAVERGRLAQHVAEERDVLVELAPHHVGARAPERVGRRVRQPALGIHARVLVLVAEDELARRQRAPCALGLRDAAAHAPVARVVAGERRLGEAVGIAEVLARVGQQLGALLVDDGDAAGALGVAAQAGGLVPERGIVERVDGGQHVQAGAVQLGLPVGRVARARVAQRLRARGHPGAELAREGGEHGVGHAERADPRGRHREVERRLRLAGAPRLGRRDARQQAPQPGAPRAGVVDAEEQIGGVGVVVAVGPQDVALEVGEVDGHAGHGHPPSRSRKAACRCRGIHALGGAREGDDVLALGERRAHLPDGGLRVRGDEEAGRLVVGAQVGLQRGAGGWLRRRRAAAPDLLGLGGELVAQLVEVRVQRAVEARREQQVRPGQAIGPGLVVGHEVGDDDPAAEVRARHAGQRARPRAQPLQVLAQRRLGAGRDRREDGERAGLARAVGIGVHRCPWTSVTNARQACAKASGSMPFARLRKSRSFASSSSAERTIVVVASG